MTNRAGDNNQLLALAEALGWPFEIVGIHYNRLRRVPFLRIGLTVVARESRHLIRPPWPDLVIGVGYTSVPVARYIRHMTGGRAKLVHIGNPRDALEDFELQITTPQYARDARPNLLTLPFPIGNPAKAAAPSLEEQLWLNALVRPRRLIAIGGPARHWELDHEAIAGAIRALAQKTPTGSLIVATSPRTRSSTRRLLEGLVGNGIDAIVEDFPRFGTLLRESDEIHATADSVSMLSEAILSGKPVGMIPIRRSLRGMLSHWLWERPLKQATLPDFRKFWAMLTRDKLVGTVELPVASQVCDTVECAANAVRSLIVPGENVDEGKPERSAPYLGASRRPGGRQRPGDRAGRSAWPAIRNQATRL